MYTAHNYQVLAASAAMEGRRAEALAAAEGSRRAVSDAMLIAMPGADWYVAELYTARVRFGLWDEILAMPAPNPKLAGLSGGYLYARALALAARHRLEEARAEFAELQQWIAKVPADAPAGMNTVRGVLGIGALVVQARIAAAERRPGEAIARLREAVQAEDQLAYNEPKDWFVPVRHLLGAQLLESHRASDAESVYREDLKKNPGNGWALYGLGESLKAQGKSAEAAQSAQQLAAAWKRADITLTASAY
jgi:tetratricopeptide (TPR) repeat protein